MAGIPKQIDDSGNVIGGNGQTKIYTKRLLIPISFDEKQQVDMLTKALKCSQGELVRKLLAKRWQQYLETGK